jgi:hypothetical protein
VLPVLRRGRLVARLDAKAHRAAGRFEVISFFLEEGVRPSAALYADISDAIVRLAAWHGTPEVVVKKTVPRGLLTELRQALKAAAP